MHTLRLAAAAVLFASSGPLAATTHDVVADFSTTSSTGTWSYGFGTTGTSFTAATDFSTCATGLACWNPASTFLGTPSVVANTSGGTLAFPTGWMASDVLIIHPGSTGAEDAIIRFTAPALGRYSVSAFFGTIGYDATGVTIKAFAPSGQFINFDLPNASQGFEQYGSVVTFNGSFVLGAGQVLDFGSNNAGIVFGDSTAVKLSIVQSAVPEPASWAMLIAGFGLVGASLRRRRMAAI